MDLADHFSPEALRNDQYASSNKLMDRMNLHALYSTNPKGLTRWIFEQIAIQSGDRVLEIGCGPGKLWSENADRLPDCRATLTDFSEGMVADARANLAPIADRFTFDVVDAESIPFDDDAFDLVIANHMLYHVADRPRALAEIARVLAPCGRFAASTPGQDNLREVGDLLREAGIADSYWGAKASAPFTLENGRAQLEPFFGDIVLECHPDSLRVLDAEPLIRYVLSMSRATSLAGDEVDRLRSVLERHLGDRGAIGIQKHVGIFLAR
jgi:ubiquinone/menaquinone biosynthesis C-methylase UbiE